MGSPSVFCLGGEEALALDAILDDNLKTKRGDRRDYTIVWRLCCFVGKAESGRIRVYVQLLNPEWSLHLFTVSAVEAILAREEARKRPMRWIPDANPCGKVRKIVAAEARLNAGQVGGGALKMTKNKQLTD